MGKKLYTTFISYDKDKSGAYVWDNNCFTNNSVKNTVPFKFGSVIGDLNALLIDNGYGTKIQTFSDISDLVVFGSDIAARAGFTEVDYYSGQMLPERGMYAGLYLGTSVVPEICPSAYSQWNNQPVYNGHINEWVQHFYKTHERMFLRVSNMWAETTGKILQRLYITPINEFGFPYYVYAGPNVAVAAGQYTEWRLNGLGYSFNAMWNTGYTPGTLINNQVKQGDQWVLRRIIISASICLSNDGKAYLVMDKGTGDYIDQQYWDLAVNPKSDITGFNDQHNRYCIIEIPIKNDTAALITPHIINEDGNVVEFYISDYGTYTTVNWLEDYNKITPDLPSDYPYNPAPPHGGDGEQDFSSDEIPAPTNPDWSAVASNLCTAYNPNILQVQAFGSELWSNDFIDSLLKLYNDPMEAVISFGVLPVPPLTTDEEFQLVMGNYKFLGENAKAKRVTSNFVNVDCGSIKIPKQYDAFMDFEPYTSMQIYLPFIGNQTVIPSDVVGHIVNLRYRIDVLTGATVATLSDETRVLYQWNGNCFTEIPLSKSDKSRLYTQIIKGVINTIQTATQGGASGGASGAGIGAAMGIISTIADVATSKHSDVVRTGSLNPTAGTLGVRTPYFIISYPSMVTPDGYASQMGIPVNAGGKIGEFSGYTVVSECHLEGIPAMQEEIQEIEQLLKGGVIL